MFRELIHRIESGNTDRVKSKVFLERFLGVPPDMTESHRLGPLFLHDMDHSYGRLMYYGCEFPLIVWNMLVFGAIDMELRNTVTAAILTFLINWIVTYARSQLGSNNISRKSLVDARFLL